MMTKVTATGCALTCLIGAAIAIGEDKLLSTAAIIGIYGLAGEMASKVANDVGWDVTGRIAQKLPAFLVQRSC